jgi:hypothetical protein
MHKESKWNTTNLPKYNWKLTYQNVLSDVTVQTKLSWSVHVSVIVNTPHTSNNIQPTVTVNTVPTYHAPQRLPNTSLQVQQCVVQFRALVQQMGELSAGFLQWLSEEGNEKLGTKVLWEKSVNKLLQRRLDHGSGQKRVTNVSICCSNQSLFPNNAHQHSEKHTLSKPISLHSLSHLLCRLQQRS